MEEMAALSCLEMHFLKFPFYERLEALLCPKNQLSQRGSCGVCDVFLSDGRRLIISILLQRPPRLASLPAGVDSESSPL